VPYRVRAELPHGGFSVTSHETAAATLSKVVEIRMAGGTVSVEDGDSVELSDNRLVELMAKEQRRKKGAATTSPERAHEAIE
jgi:hypothetical protein